MHTWQRCVSSEVKRPLILGTPTPFLRTAYHIDATYPTHTPSTLTTANSAHCHTSVPRILPYLSTAQPSLSTVHILPSASTVHIAHYPQAEEAPALAVLPSYPPSVLRIRPSLSTAEADIVLALAVLPSLSNEHPTLAQYRRD
eukprot:3214336-Rhodomonas_salina.5